MWTNTPTQNNLGSKNYSNAQSSQDVAGACMILPTMFYHIQHLYHDSWANFETMIASDIITGLTKHSSPPKTLTFASYTAQDDN